MVALFMFTDVSYWPTLVHRIAEKHTYRIAACWKQAATQLTLF